jgi:hypothetical protein
LWHISHSVRSCPTGLLTWTSLVIRQSVEADDLGELVHDEVGAPFAGPLAHAAGVARASPDLILFSEAISDHYAAGARQAVRQARGAVSVDSLAAQRSRACFAAQLAPRSASPACLGQPLDLLDPTMGSSPVRWQPTRPEVASAEPEVAYPTPEVVYPAPWVQSATEDPSATPNLDSMLDSLIGELGVDPMAIEIDDDPGLVDTAARVDEGAEFAFLDRRKLRVAADRCGWERAVDQVAPRNSHYAGEADQDGANSNRCKPGPPNSEPPRSTESRAKPSSVPKSSRVCARGPPKRSPKS